MGLVPLLAVDVELHEAFEVAEPEVGLLGEGVVARLLEVVGAQLDLGRVLLLVEVLADLHDLVEVVLLAVDLDGLCFPWGKKVAAQDLGSQRKAQRRQRTKRMKIEEDR